MSPCRALLRPATPERAPTLTCGYPPLRYPDSPGVPRAFTGRRRDREGPDPSDGRTMDAAWITGGVAVVALLVQYFSNARALSQQATIAREGREHESRQMFDARHQDRIEDAYFGLVESLYRQTMFRAWGERAGEPTPGNSPPFYPPSADDILKVTARATIFSSPEVRDLIARWQLALSA